MAALRNLWLKAHRWVALGLGWILILSGITGSLLVVLRPLDRWQHPDYFVAANTIPQAQIALEPLRQRLASEFGPKTSLSFLPPREAAETMQVLVRGAWRGTLYLNPSSGLEQGRRGENEGVVAWLYGLHSALLLAEPGKAILAFAALAYLLLAISGVVLWWPRNWPPSWRITFGKGLPRALFDLHRTAGAALALALALCIGTGAYMAWRPIGTWITWLSGAPRTTVPALPAQAAGKSQGQAVVLDDLVASARAAFPDGAIGIILYTPRLDRPMAIRMRLPDDPHPNGRSTVWFDPRSGAVLAAHRWNELDPGTRINSVIYPLHTGELGGLPWQIGVALLGLALGVLGGSGIWLWWSRRAARRRAVARAIRVPGQHS